MSKRAKDKEPNEVVTDNTTAKALGFDPVEEKTHTPKGITEKPAETLAQKQERETAGTKAAELKCQRVPVVLKYVGPPNAIKYGGPITREDKEIVKGVKKLVQGDELKTTTKEHVALERHYPGMFERVGG